MTSLYRHPLLIGYGNFMFRHRNKAFPVILLALLLAFRPAYTPDGDRIDFVFDVAALLLALSGETVRMLAVGLDYIKRGGLNKRVYADQIVTNGMFAHCRNPLYLGNLMIAFALLSLSDRLGFVMVGGALVVLTYMAIVAAEEQYLRGTFAEAYESYARKTNRWILDLRGLRGTMQATEFNWRRVLYKESSSFYSWIVAAFLIDGIETHFPFGSLERPEFLMFFALFVAATLAFVTIRFMKKIGSKATST